MTIKIIFIKYLLYIILKMFDLIEQSSFTKVESVYIDKKQIGS